MKIAILLAVSVLILSQGYGMAYGEKLTFTTDSTSYDKGATIEVSGLISDYDASDPLKVYQLTLRVVDPKNNIVTVSQFDPNDDGTFATSINSDGPTWKFSGDYKIMLNYGDLSGHYTFSLFVPTSEPESDIIEEVVDVAEEVVDVAEEVVDVAEVVAEEVVEEVSGALQCGPGTTEEGGICIIDESGSFNPQIEEGSFYAIIVPTAIAFGIGMAVLVALALIARAHRK